MNDNLPDQNSNILQQVGSEDIELQDGFLGELDNFGSFSALEAFKILLEAYRKTGDPKYVNPVDYFKSKYEYYPEDPVSLERWLEDPYYFGHVGSSMFPKVKEDFYNIMARNPRPMKVILKGSIGWGKTFLTCVIMARIIYELGCLRSPQQYYGLSQTSTITFMNMSLTSLHAKKVMYTELKEMIDASQWFRARFRRKKNLVNMLYWPKKLIAFLPGNSSELEPMGQNLFGGVIEEANFFPVVKASSRIKNTLEREWNQAKHLHDTIWRRMKSRYQRKGRVPGMLILNSSANYPDDFLERLSGEADADTLVIEHSEWETKPPTRYSGKKFFVFVGDAYHAPAVIQSEAQKQEFENTGLVYEVPIEHYRDFQTDIVGAIRDILGKHARPSNRFFQDVAKINSMINENIPVPFAERYREGTPYEELFEALKYSKFFNPIMNMTGKKVLKLHPDAPRYCHVDLGISGDSTGICVLHVGSVEEVRRQLDTGDTVKEIVPIFYVDLIMEILPPKESQIQIDDIRTLIIDLNQKVGFKFRRITFDSWQSISTIQLLQRRFGEDVVGVLATKKRIGGEWWSLRETLYSGRLFCYEYPPLLRQLMLMEYDTATGIIDHPVGGHDDVAISLASAIYSAMTEFDISIADKPQKGIVEVSQSEEEKLYKETVNWLTSDGKTEKRKGKPDEFDESYWDIDHLSLGETEEQLKKIFESDGEEGGV